MPEIAVLVPCYNEEATIGKVVRDFIGVLPGAQVYVYDNNSKDNTVLRAREAGAIVRSERQQGKGHVVRRMFADIDADVYLLVDGDATYDAASAPRMITLLLEGPHDMVNAARVENHEKAYRRGHRFGNRLISGLVVQLFGAATRDVLSGYRAFSRRFVKSYPALARGFEIETDLTVHALQLRMPVTEIDTPYSERPEGSFSKLNTVRDGIRIMLTITHLIKEEKPIMFFGTVGFLLMVLALVLGVPVIDEYMETHLVPRLPTAILAMGCGMLGLVSFMCGLILDSITRGRLEAKRMHYLRESAHTR